MRNHPLILAHFPIFDRFQKSKKTAKLKREWLFFIKFSIKMPEFNRFPSKAYALGLRMLACMTECETQDYNCISANQFLFRNISRSLNFRHGKRGAHILYRVLAQAVFLRNATPIITHRQEYFVCHIRRGFFVYSEMPRNFYRQIDG